MQTADLYRLQTGHKNTVSELKLFFFSSEHDNMSVNLQTSQIQTHQALVGGAVVS